MDSKLKSKLSAKSKWLRLLFILIFFVIKFIVKYIVWFVSLVQFVIVLFTDKPNQTMLEFGENLSIYIAQIFRFLTYNSDERPFPFSPWTGTKISAKETGDSETNAGRGRKKKS